MHAENDYVDKLLETVAKNVEVDIPEEMVEEEVDRMLERYNEQLRSQGASIEMYYAFTKTTEKDLRASMERELVEILKDYKGTVVFVTHDIAEAYRVCDKIIVFDGGKANGWNNCVTLMLIDKPTVEKHSIEIKMAKGFEKKGFTIVTMGYSK